MHQFTLSELMFVLQKGLFELAAIMYDRILFNLEYNHIFFGGEAIRQGDLMLAGKYFILTLLEHDIITKFSFRNSYMT